MACELDRYVPAKAFALADAMTEEFGAEAFAVARRRLKMRIRDELPTMINLYAGVCTLLAERQARGARWSQRLRRTVAALGEGWRGDVAMRHDLVPVRIAVLRPARRDR